MPVQAGLRVVLGYGDACWPFVCFCTNEEILIQVFCPFLLGLFVVLLLCEFLIYFEYEPLMGYVVCKYFLPFHRLPFHFIDSFLCRTGF